MALNRTTSFDGVPVFKGHALMLADARRNGWSGHVTSADRRYGVAEKYGKMSQAALWAGWLAHKAGFNPANPPGRSSHELRSDGVAFKGPAGRPLPWWQLGMDTTEAPELRRVLGSLGYGARRPYADAREEHHTNLTRNPRRRLRKRKLLPKRKVKRRPAADPKTMKLDAAGLNFISKSEGFRSKAYKPVATEPGWTVGFGHHGPDVKPNTTVTHAEALLLLAKDLRQAEGTVRSTVTRPLTQAQYNALVSFVFNVGPGAFGGSTLLRKLNDGDTKGAADEFLRWDKGGSPPKPMAGLARRRAEERRTFLSAS